MVFVLLVGLVTSVLGQETASSVNPLQCGFNEIYTEAKRTCPPEDCPVSNAFLTWLCDPDADINRKPGCICISGHLRNSSGVCIPSSECPNDKELRCPDPNAVYSQCASACTPTCSNINPICTQQCLSPRCQCKRGFVLDNGKCIQPKDCPATTQCPVNETFVPCSMCRNDRCPETDNRLQAACLPPTPCPSGCACKLNHKRKASGQCILASECPPVNCTRPNEVWSPCPFECNSEYCDAVDQEPVVCNTLLLNCQPKCVCKKNYFRGNGDICISADECRARARSSPN
ncbi:hypothetical protein ACJJTC_019821 [Scirpophaga incertulas]